MLEAYESLRAALGMAHALPPYNLLATRDWMLLVPRSCAESHGINVNAMGFAGSLLVRCRATPEAAGAGAAEILRQVTPPPRP